MSLGGCGIVFSALVALAVTPLSATGFEIISVPDASVVPNAGGGGDSGLPISTPDGRYLLFASTAENLALTASSNGVPSLVPPSINVFLRDRSNAVTELVSVNLTGTGGGNGDSLPSGISADGRYVLFESHASDLLPGDTNRTSDIFLRDMVQRTTILVSATPAGTSGNGAARSGVLTPNGRYVAFVSAATNLVPGDTNMLADVFVRDVQAATTTLISLGARSTNASLLPASSESPAITPDARYVAFYSTATNLAPGVGTAGEIYVRDLVAGTTLWASSNAHAILGALFGNSNSVSFNHKLSDDGQFLAYAAATNGPYSDASPVVILRCHLQTGDTDILHTNAYLPWGALQDIHNLDATPDGRFVALVARTAPTASAIFLWDSHTGTNALVSADLNNGLPTAGTCDSPVLDPTGRYVAFLSTATNLTTNVLSGGMHLYVRDVQTGVTRLADADSTGVGGGVSPCVVPTLIMDGPAPAFEAPDGRLVAEDHNRASDVFVISLANSVELISSRHPALPSATGNGPSLLNSASMSTGGHVVAFVSAADNLVSNDTNGLRDVFVRDRIAGHTSLVSVGTNGFAAGGASFAPVVSGDGRYVAFTSYAANLVAGDTNGLPDVFVRNLQNQTTSLASVSTNGISAANGGSGVLALSSNGQYVLFLSTAQDLTQIGGLVGTNLFLRDQITVTTLPLTMAGGSLAAMTPDSRYIAFVGSITPSNPGAIGLYVWDVMAGARVYTNAAPTTSAIGISPNGRLVCYVTNASFLSIADLAPKTNWSISMGPFGSHAGLRFSADGHWLVYATAASNSASDTNGAQDVYLYDLQARTNLLVSHSYISGKAANAASDAPDISADGRFVVYRSVATNNVPGDTNNAPDLFLYDRASGATTLLSANPVANRSANGWSLQPWFSADGQMLVFESWAADIARRDFNHASDLFALTLATPVIADSDGDSMDDGWELAHFGTLTRNGNGDFDGDGAPDLFEFKTGTDPSNANSLFRIQVAAAPGQALALSWPVAPGKLYHVQFKDALADPDWQEFAGYVSIIGTAGFAYDVAPPIQRFYRILLNP